MRVYLTTWDWGIHLMEAAQRLLSRHWSVTQPVTIVGYNKPSFPLADNFEFRSFGEYRGVEHMGEDFLNFFSSIEDEHFIYSVGDHLLIRPVNERILGVLTDIMVKEKDIGRISLTGNTEKSRPYDYFLYQEHDGFDVMEALPDAKYKLIALWSMWRKEYFLKYWEPGMTFWQWETEGSERAKNDGWRVLCTYGDYALAANHVYRRQQLNPDWHHGIDKYHRELFKEDKEMIWQTLRGDVKSRTWHMPT